MSPESKRKLQIFLGLAILIAGVRTAWIVWERHEANKVEPKVEKGLNPDYYVIPKKLHAYDLKSARDLTKQPVWVKEGYKYTFYPYDAAQKKANFREGSGLLLPLEKLQITDVVLDSSPEAPGQKQVMAVFEKNGKSFAFPIGAEKGDDFRSYADEMLFLEDPRELYKHWSAETWDAISKHEVHPGMNELQADFAIGFATLEGSGEGSERVLNYPNGGHPVRIVYRDGKAVEIKAAGSH